MEYIKNQDVSEGELSLVCKKSKRNVSIKMDNPPLTCQTEAMQQQMTNVKASCDEIITESSKADCIRVSVYTSQSENFATLSEKNVKEIKDFRKKLKQNKNEEKKEKKSKKKLKNIGAVQQQMTTVKMSHNEIITKPKADCIRVRVDTAQFKNFATLSEKNVKEIKDVRKKLEQNKNEEKKETKSKKKLKNIGAAQQQMTTVKMSHNEIITKPKADCIRVRVDTAQFKNFATLSEKNVKEIKDVRKKLEQNKYEEKKKKKSKKKLKNIGAAQQQMTTVKMSHNEIITKSKADCIRVRVDTPQFENFATLSEKNVKEIKDFRKKLEQNKNEEKKEKKSNKKLKNMGAAQQQMTIEMSHSEIITKPKADCVRVPVYTRQSENFATLSEKNDKKIKYVSEKFEQNKEELKNAKIIQEQITTNRKTAGVEKTFVPSKIHDEKCELMKQNVHLRTNRQYVIEKMKQKMIENDLASYPKNTSKVSNVVKVSRKDYITLPSVTLQRARIKEEDYSHIAPRPTNIVEELDKSMKLLKKVKEYNKDSLINLMEDFDSIKKIINKAIIKMWKLLEKIMKMNDL